MGNVPVGMMLLRVVDPQFETPALESFSYKHTFHAPIFFSILAFLPIIAHMWGVEVIFILSLLVICTCLLIAKLAGYWGQQRSPFFKRYQKSFQCF